MLSTFMNVTYLTVAGSDIAYRTTIATATTIPMTRRARRPERAGDEVEADLLAFLQPERRAQQHHVQPRDDRQLGRPADREVEEIAEDDLDDEGDEHDAEQRGDDVLRAAANPVDGAARRMHGSPSSLQPRPGSRRLAAACHGSAAAGRATRGSARYFIALIFSSMPRRPGLRFVRREIHLLRVARNALTSGA